jgi:hypothetical protein
MICSDVCCPSLHGHVDLSSNLNLCRQALVFPCPVTSAVNSYVIGIFIFNHCSSLGKKDRQTAPFSQLSHCHCHCSSPFLLILVPLYLHTYVCTGILFLLFSLLSSKITYLVILIRLIVRCLYVLL